MSKQWVAKNFESEELDARIQMGMVFPCIGKITANPETTPKYDKRSLPHDYENSRVIIVGYLKSCRRVGARKSRFIHTRGYVLHKAGRKAIRDLKCVSKMVNAHIRDNRNVSWESVNGK